MTTRDSIFSYVHLDDSNHVLFMEKWQDEPIPFDDIDTQILFESTSNLFLNSLFDDDDGGMSIHFNTLEFKVHKNQKFLKENVWVDLSIYEKFTNKSDKVNKILDQSLLKPLHSYYLSDENSNLNLLNNKLKINDFLSNKQFFNNNQNSINGSNLDNGSEIHPTDFSLNSTSYMLGSLNNTFLNYKSNSTSNSIYQMMNLQNAQTPNPVKRNSSKNEKNHHLSFIKSLRQ